MASRLLLLLVCIKLMEGSPAEETSTRLSSTFLKDNRKSITTSPKASNILMDMLDVRTPPKIKLKQDKMKFESSHPGVAIPVDEELVNLDDATKKFNFYKLDRPTTDSTISTWILLSGQSAATTKSPNPPDGKTRNDTIVPIYHRTPKPTSIIDTKVKDKIKFTEINKSYAAKNKKKQTTEENKVTKDPKQPSTSTEISISDQTESDKIKLKNKKKITVITTIVSSSTESLKKNETTLSLGTANPVANSSSAALESKDGSVSLNNDKKKSSGKKKKNKRRRKPSNKVDTNTKIKNKADAMGAQLYSYLSREIVPTIGVGLVGLMVTAGLASYFLFPFGAARRAMDIDRKDKDNYFYKDEYSGGMLEEDAIGQVIAGMPTNRVYSTLKSSSPKTNYPNKVYRSNVQSSMQYNHPYKKYGKESLESVSPLFERDDNDEHNKQNERISDNKISDTRFVVGSVRKEEIEQVTPITVPEHGPRSLETYAKFKRTPRVAKVVDLSTQDNKKDN